MMSVLVLSGCSRKAEEVAVTAAPTTERVVVTTEAEVEGSARSRREEPVVQPAPVAMSAARAVAASSIAVRTERNRTLPALPAKCVIGVRSFRQSFVARGKGPVSYSLPARARSSQTVAMSIAA